jgi:hypothetical protein
MVSVALNSLSKGFIVQHIAVIRNLTNTQNTYFNFNNYISYPIILSSPVNMILVVIFFWKLLKKNSEMKFDTQFFNVINSVYVVSCGWVLTSAFVTLVQIR